MEVLPFKYLDLEQVLEVSPCRSKSALYLAIKKGEAPEPDRIGGRSLWRSDKIAAWMQAQAESADRERQKRASEGAMHARRMVEARQAKPLLAA